MAGCFVTTGSRALCASDSVQVLDVEFSAATLARIFNALSVARNSARGRRSALNGRGAALLGGSRVGHLDELTDGLVPAMSLDTAHRICVPVEKPPSAAF